MKNVADIYPLTPAQAGILFHTLQAPDSGVYFEQYVCTLSGRLDIDAFHQAWHTVVHRHAVLRTEFIWEGIDEPLQVVRQTVEIPFVHQDWRKLTSAEKRDRLATHLRQDRLHGFDPAKAPLIRLALFQLETTVHHMVWSFHHLQLDGWSTALVLKEVFACYEALHRGEVPESSAPRPFKDYVGWLQKQDIHQAEAFWKKELVGFSAPTALRVGKGARAKVPAGNYEQCESKLPEPLTARLQQLAQQHRLTLNTIVQGAWAILLSRYSGERDVLFGTTVSGRPADLPGVESMIGMFINTLPVRVQVEPDVDLLPWLKAIQSRQLELHRYAYSPLTKIQAWSDIPKGQSLFETIVVFENYPIDGSAFQDGNPSLHVENVRYLEQSNYPLSVLAIPGPQLVLLAIYDRAYLDDDTVSRMMGHLRTVLSSMASHATQSISDISHLTAQERLQLTVEWNDTRTDYPHVACIHQLIEEQAAQNPTGIAVQFRDQQLSYRDLDGRANQLAHYLRAQGVGPGDLVGICLERSLEMIVALVAVLKAGAAYVPLDPTYPQARLAFMLADTQAPVVLTQQHLTGRLPHYTGQAICLDTDWPTIAQQRDQKPANDATTTDPVYVIYTSGSTGKPKGVQITHRNLIHSTQARLDYYPEPVSSFLLLSSYAFDSSVVGIFGTLCQGGTLILPAPGDEQDIEAIAGLIKRHHVTDTLCLPSLYNLILTYAQTDQLSSLKTVIVAGEACPLDIVQCHYQRLPQTTLYNEYGPTEATVWCTVYRVPAKGVETPVPIGRPTANTQVFILDKDHRLVPIGVPGELYIGGDGLARGYLNRPELTADKFIASPFGQDRLYKTGDLVRYLPDGNIQFLGRIDHQVKIRGYRIELDEIQLALNQHPQIRESVVVAWGSEQGPRLVAYFVPISESVPSRTDLRSFLQAKLPDYMLPSVYVELDVLPLTPNGKINRRALPNPETIHLDQGENLAPRDLLELQLIRVWEEVLGIENVGVMDNFFEIGGHSLLAIRLVSRIQQFTGVKLPLASLFQAPTVEQLASLMRRDGWTVPTSALVAIQASGTKPPLFFVPGNMGNVFTDLGELARNLRSDQPFYGLQDSVENPIQVAALAEHYVEAIRAVQPQGPYLLGGICSGGLVAYEMAQQLHKHGQQVALLALVESYLFEPGLRTYFGLAASLVGQLLRGTTRQLRQVSEVNAAGRGTYLRLKAKVLGNLWGMVRYPLQSYPGRLELFFTRQGLDWVNASQSSWRSLARGGVTIHEIPGSHDSITRNNNAEIDPVSMQVLADQLQRCIERVLRLEA
jgi:amino acid adenylation domain-containing protein